MIGDDEDNELWSQTMGDVSPINKKDIEAPKEEQQRPKKKKFKENNFRPSARETYTPETLSSSELDRSTETKFKRGQMVIEGRIDLHGMTQNQAHDALLSFIPNAYHSGKRCVIVITGKGAKRTGDTSLLEQTTGVLRRRTPEWLSTPPLNSYVLKYHKAKPNHGGDGALYVLLRRNRA